MFPLLLVLLLSQAAQAAPLYTRQTSPDLTVVKVCTILCPSEGTEEKFAALAELLESTFYTQALEKFTAQDFEQAGYVDGQLLIDQLTYVPSPPLLFPFEHRAYLMVS
jgi:hypothetical protein